MIITDRNKKLTTEGTEFTEEKIIGFSVFSVISVVKDIRR